MARKGIPAGSPLTGRSRPAGRLRVIFACFAAVLPLLLGGGVKTASAQQGVLEIRLKDHREAIDDFSRLTIKIGKIAVSPKPGFAFWKAEWRELSPSTAAIDLTKYTGKESVVVFREMIGAGAFDAIQLKLDGLEGILKKNQRQAAVKSILTPIKLSFSVEPKGETVIVLDLVVLDMSDHPPRGYELGIQGYEVRIDGRLIDKIPPG